MSDVFDGELPDFDAFRKAVREGSPRESVCVWADKMQAWAAGALAELAATEEKLRAEINSLDEANAALDKRLTEAEQDAEALEDLKNRILDVERGICTPQELHLEVRSLG